MPAIARGEREALGQNEARKWCRCWWIDLLLDFCYDRFHSHKDLWVPLDRIFLLESSRTVLVVANRINEDKVKHS